ncbi:SDR family NAD(P)-dependent oxidoreductase [Salipaludibacillus sp. CF4.18]|uniref:SDR family NAD(P)-dependent oxidoreductase n=1 Tax=Salipaludibacillus sp. CF4.18 TaxID=3373081 RepID=UPI003EE4556D
MTKKLLDELVAISGASGGIGEEMAFEVARRGGTPILLARSEDKLKKVAEAIFDETGITVPFYKLDVSNTEDIHYTFQHIYENIGMITTLINNAGFAKFDLVEDADINDIEAMFRVNVLGTIACTKAVLPYMLEKGFGQIIFIGSQAGKLATPKSSAYSASKHAVLGFANALRMELHDKPIYVSVVNPGPVQTAFFEHADKTGQYEKSVKKFMLDPYVVAYKIVRLIDKPKRELNLPLWMGIGSKLYQLFPSLIEKVAGKQLHQK